MTRITQAVLVEAARAVDRMGAQERLQLADEVFAHQPNLLASVVVLRQMGASDAQIEVPLLNLVERVLGTESASAQQQRFAAKPPTPGLYTTARELSKDAVRLPLTPRSTSRCGGSRDTACARTKKCPRCRRPSTAA